MKLKSTLKSRWQLRYDAVKQNTHLGIIKSNIEPWPWCNMKSRRTETAMARLRIGHARLKAHLFRFGLATNPDCTLCGTPEDTQHILEECPRSRAHRNVLHLKLRSMGIQVPSIKILLGGGDFDPPTQSLLMKAVK